MSVTDAICAGISQATQQEFVLERQAPVGGGSINTAMVVTGTCGRQFFVKRNASDKLEMFSAEAEGLADLAEARAIRIPEAVCVGEAAGESFIVMEYIPFAPGNAGSASDFGRQLAQLHRYSADKFGWHRDNTIGTTPQPNAQSRDWVAFLREQRLGFQLELAHGKGVGAGLLKKGRHLLAGLDFYFETYTPAVSILHGDLWSGNYAFDSDSAPIIFDPAVYFGDRESDLAMTELFGGFQPAFYAAYERAWPLDPGYARRKKLYQLYHILNHFNLFGGGYAGQAESMLDELLACLP
ncbi:fructosamine kinase family protein [Sulfuriflexus sp.]|uniref:fructosamine kinase family protein n=1 Tax=Sulfuriflexus sp. TaxID=2015443 RepID=UPI0028CE18C3|nr:fructosamine kinase family protein [Sulfuriflexus sp.]MDT8403163.1 fructosamine kinase family protein [Sulfuriflexus sp.]